MVKRREKVLRPVMPNLGIGAAFRRKLVALLDEMAGSYEKWVVAQYRRKPPEIAADASPAAELRRELNRLSRQWRSRFDDAAPRMAAWFAQAAATRSDAAMRKILRDAGISIRFQMTPAMRDILEATVAENVALIKSIPQQYASQIESMVMTSVVAGRDLSKLSRDLYKRYDITKKRANLIARDQNNKATAALTRARQLEVGIEEAIWLHSLGGKEPRKTHLRNNGNRYDVNRGWFDPDPRVRERIFPGQLINCRCVSKPIVKGFT
jgi:uncharacterized protein with gpF-like domain